MLQRGFTPELTAAIYPEGLGTPAQGLGPPNFVPGVGIPWHTQPGSSRQGRATGEPSQLQVLEKPERYQYLLSTLGSQSFPFAGLRTASRAVYRQQGAPQRA